MNEKEESGAALNTAEMIDGGWLVLKVEDEIIRDANFPEGIRASKLAETERLVYNLSQSCFGYGCDAMDWENASDEWIEFEEMDEYDSGKLLLYFDIGYMPCSWIWLDGSEEGVIAKIEAGHITEVYSIKDEEWIDAGDQGIEFEVSAIFPSFRVALSEVSE